MQTNPSEAWQNYLIMGLGLCDGWYSNPDDVCSITSVRSYMLPRVRVWKTGQVWEVYNDRACLLFDPRKADGVYT